MEISLDVKIKATDLYDYMLYHQYTSASGLIGNCVGALMVFAFMLNHQWIFLIIGVIILLYLPWTLFVKSSQQVLNNPAFKEVLKYTLNEEGLAITLSEEMQMQKWEDMYKAVSTTRSIIVYTSPINATIIPRRCIDENKMQVIKIISTHMPPKKVKIRG